jgi:hypothetical protein
MPSSKEREITAPDCNCGPLEPKPSEKPIKEGTSADQILAKVQLACDDNTGVFFFRRDRKLYMRMVELE